MRNAKQKKDPPAGNYILLFARRDELIDSSDPRSGLTGLEPAASALTGRCSDRLNYNPRVYSLQILFLFSHIRTILFRRVVTETRMIYYIII